MGITLQKQDYSKIMGNITASFSFSEWEHNTHKVVIDLESDHYVNIKLLCDSALQPTRDKFKRIDISSGVRNETLNELVNGSEDSDHKYGLAADIIPRKADLVQVFLWMVKNVPYRELILHLEEGYIHISINTANRDYKKYADIKGVSNV